MNATADGPSAGELDQLSGLLTAPELDRGALVAALRRIEHGLHEHERDLDRSGGLLDEQDKARRRSLSREDDRLREEMSALLLDAQSVRQAAADGSDEDLRR